MYIVRAWHRPDNDAIPSPATERGWHIVKIEIQKYAAFVTLVFQGDEGYDVTPFNILTMVVVTIPPRPISRDEAERVVGRVLPHMWGDALNYFVVSSDRVFRITMHFSLFTLDEYDPADKESWPELLKELVSIEMASYFNDGDRKEEYEYAWIFSDISLKILEEGCADRESLIEAKKVNKVIKTILDDIGTWLFEKYSKITIERNYFNDGDIYMFLCGYMDCKVLRRNIDKIYSALF